MSTIIPPPPGGYRRRSSDTVPIDRALLDAELAKIRAATPEPVAAAAENCPCEGLGCEVCTPLPEDM